MADTFDLTLVQENPTVGDLDGNAELIRRHWQESIPTATDLVAFPELFLSGYPVQDLVLKPAFVAACGRRVEQLAKQCSVGPAVGFGAPSINDGKLYNTYFILKNGAVAAEILKHKLPNTEVFDEVRQFQPGPICGPVEINAARVGVPICEDSWSEDVCETLAESGADLLLSVNGSPYYRGKMEKRVMNMVARVVETELPLAYLNLTGGQDDQVFDGGSFVLNQGGELVHQLPLFEEAVRRVRFFRNETVWQAEAGHLATLPDDWEQDYRAMVRSVQEFVHKNKFSRVLVGISGGIDSALVATIAVDALGPNRVRCVRLPSNFTSEESMLDAAAMSANLGCHMDTVQIDRLQKVVGAELSELFSGLELDQTEENIQSRLRGLLLMAISNKFGELLLTTGNKSEAAVGYATIYGDMAGAYNPIKDLYKTRVFETCRWRNRNHRDWMSGPAGVCVPESIIAKPPSAELRFDQRDSDSLPPYDELDAILEMLIDRDLSCLDAVMAGYDAKTVKRVERLIYGAEHKRFQSAPGVKLTERALWLDRRYPITNHWRDDELNGQ